MKPISDAELTNAGERMIVGNISGYWAHLSIYHFALPFARGRRVLDAGCGAGYGAAYLARHGAQSAGFGCEPRGYRALPPALCRRSRDV